MAMNARRQQARGLITELTEYFPKGKYTGYKELGKVLNKSPYDLSPRSPGNFTQASLNKMENVLQACRKLEVAGLSKEQIRDIMLDKENTLLTIINEVNLSVLNQLFPDQYLQAILPED